MCNNTYTCLPTQSAQRQRQCEREKNRMHRAESHRTARSRIYRALVIFQFRHLSNFVQLFLVRFFSHLYADAASFVNDEHHHTMKDKRRKNTPDKRENVNLIATLLHSLYHPLLFTVSAFFLFLFLCFLPFFLLTHRQLSL